MINERFGTEFTQADELFFHEIRAEAVADESIRQAASANTLDNFRYVFLKALEGLFIDRMEQNEDPDLKIARPRQVYLGANRRDYVPVEARR